MRIRFSQSNQNTRMSDSLLVRVTTTDGHTGIGECCPRSYVTGETASTTFASLEAQAQTLAGQSWESFGDLRAWLQADLNLEPAATCGLELALLDAWGKTHGQSVVNLLGGELPTVISYSGVVPMSSQTSLEPLLSRFRFPSVKIKVGSDLLWNLARISWVRSLMGEEVDIRVDVNGGWSLQESLKQIPCLTLAGIRCFEQPLPSECDHEMPFLTRELGQEVLLMADESLTTVDSACRLLDSGAFNAFNLKLSKHGGLLRSLDIYRMAREQGLPCQLGAHFGETSILTAAGVAFCGMAPKLLHREGALGTWLLEHDICEGSLRIDQQGQFRVTESFRKAPGLGIQVGTESPAENIAEQEVS